MAAARAAAAAAGCWRRRPVWACTAHPNHRLLTQTQMQQVVPVYARLLNHLRFLSTLAAHQQMPLMLQEAQPI
ncbi:MAG: hypothetical protein U0931_26895 [Vulcanimicrobiota bacterium]